MPCSAQSLINSAYANGYAALSERDLEACILAAACSGGGTGGSGITISGVDASGVPATGQKLWVNANTNHAWVPNVAGTAWQILLG